MDETKEFDLEAQDWINIKTQEDFEKELLLTKEKLDNEKKQKEILKKDVNEYLKKTVEALKEIDLAVLNTETLKIENENQEKLLTHKIKQCAKQTKNQKKQAKLQRKFLKSLENEIAKNEALEKKITSLESALIFKDIEQNKIKDELRTSKTWASHFERMFDRREDELRLKNNEIRTLTETLSQKEDELIKLRQILNETKSYATAAKLGNLSVFAPNETRSPKDQVRIKIR